MVENGVPLSANVLMVGLGTPPLILKMEMEDFGVPHAELKVESGTPNTGFVVVKGALSVRFFWPIFGFKGIPLEVFK